MRNKLYNNELGISKDVLKEGVDFYIEYGNTVFTTAYLKKRGTCCKSGCRHCPYGYVKKKRK